MKYYLDIDYRIISIDKEPLFYNYTHETDERQEDSIFANMCSTAIKLYKHEPQYEYNEDGSIKLDDSGLPIFKLDENNQKIISGWSTYPYVNYDVIISFQNEYEIKEQEKTELQLALAEQYENNIKLEESITNTQLALAEFYEAINEQ